MEINERPKIIYNYVRTWLVFDVLSSIPMDTLTILGLIDENSITKNNQLLRILKLPK